MPVIGVRPATVDDVDFLDHVLHMTHIQSEPRAADEPWGGGARKDALDQVQGKIQDSITYIIEVDGEPAGRLRVIRTAARTEIAGIQILPAQQGKGAGTAAITELLREATDRRVPVELQVNVHNPNAERLYTRLGFRRRGREGDDYWMTKSAD